MHFTIFIDKKKKKRKDSIKDNCQEVRAIVENDSSSEVTGGNKKTSDVSSVNNAPFSFGIQCIDGGIKQTSLLRTAIHLSTRTHFGADKVNALQSFVLL